MAYTWRLVEVRIGDAAFQRMALVLRRLLAAPRVTSDRRWRLGPRQTTGRPASTFQVGKSSAA